MILMAQPIAVAVESEAGMDRTRQRHPSQAFCSWVASRLLKVGAAGVAAEAAPSRVIRHPLRAWWQVVLF